MFMRLLTVLRLTNEEEADEAARLDCWVVCTEDKFMASD